MILTNEWESFKDIRNRVAVDPSKLINYLSREFYARRLAICMGEEAGAKLSYYRRMEPAK